MHSIFFLPSFKQGNLNERSSLAHLHPVYKQTKMKVYNHENTAMFSAVLIKKNIEVWLHKSAEGIKEMYSKLAQLLRSNELKLGLEVSAGARE